MNVYIVVTRGYDDTMIVPRFHTCPLAAEGAANALRDEYWLNTIELAFGQVKCYRDMLEKHNAEGPKSNQVYSSWRDWGAYIEAELRKRTEHYAAICVGMYEGDDVEVMTLEPGS